MKKAILLGVGLLVWLAALAVGHALLLQHQAPGQPAVTPAAWPADTALRREPGRPALLLFAHPQCPCTRTSLAELAWLLARANTAVDVTVVTVLPPGAPPDWKGLPAEADGVRAWTDRDGVEARRFGAATSGQVMLYGGAGELLFSGGITFGRGHQGDNPGRQAVLGWLTEGRGRGAAPVFGCSLFDEAEAPSSEPGGRIACCE